MIAFSCEKPRVEFQYNVVVTCLEILNVMPLNAETRDECTEVLRLIVRNGIGEALSGNM